MNNSSLFRQLLLAIFLLVMFTATTAAAKGLGVFVINFDTPENQSPVWSMVKQQLDRVDTGVVIDAQEQSLIGYYERGDDNYNTDYIRRTLAERYREGNDGAVNLARDFDFVADVLKRFTGSMDQADIFLINAQFHQDEQFNFSDGYPNDGFLFKNDNEFFYIAPVTTVKTRLHVLTTARTDFGQQYQRFFTHLGKKLFDAELATFSLATTAGAMTVGEKPELAITPIDQGVNRSLVIGKERTPICPYEDRIVRSDKEARVVELSVINPCRKNTQVSFKIIAGGQTRVENVQADDTGKAVLRLELKAGENRVELTGLDNVSREIFKTQAQAIDDQVEQTWEEGSVDLVGRNPLRRDGDMVTITHPASGRKWEVRVTNGAWRIKAPVQTGNQRFLVSRPDGGEPQVVDVEAGKACEDRVEASQLDGTGTIRITNPCRVGQGITFRYMEESYLRPFAANGVAEVKLSLNCNENEIFYSGHDGGDRVVRLKVDCKDLIKISLKWSAPVDLDLHIQEKDADPGQKGWIYFGNMNHDRRKGLGELDIDDQGRNQGTKVENYKLKASTYPAGKMPNHFVVNYTRGTNPQPPHCGDGELARIPYQVTVINRNLSSETFSGVLESVPCGVALPGDPRLLGKQGPDGQRRPSVAVDGHEPPVTEQPRQPPPQPPVSEQPRQPLQPPEPPPQPRLMPDKAVTAMNQESVVMVLDNDTAVPAGSAPQVVEPPGHGTARVEGGVVHYTPQTGYAGVDRFRYGVGGATAEVQIWIAECPSGQIDPSRWSQLVPEKAFACGIIKLLAGDEFAGKFFLGSAKNKQYAPATRFLEAYGQAKAAGASAEQAVRQALAR